jgi:hypothetical protein
VKPNFEYHAPSFSCVEYMIQKQMPKCMIILHGVVPVLLNEYDYVNYKVRWLNHKRVKMIDNKNEAVVQLNQFRLDFEVYEEG